MEDMMKKHTLFYSILLAFLLSSGFIGLVPQAQGQTVPRTTDRAHYI